MSEDFDADAVVEALNHGADYVLVKPVQRERLLSVVKEKLGVASVRASSIGKDEVTVVLPVLNEEEAIGLVLGELREEGYDDVIVVDGYSSDDSVKIAGEFGVTVVYQHGKGKTGALKTAFEHVHTPYLLVMDGDHTYSGKDIGRFLPIAREFDQIFGIRTEGRENMSLLHRFGNWVINKSLNVLYDTGISDVCSGMYMMRTDVARGLELRSCGFDVEVEAAIQNITNGKVTEVPVSFRRRLGKRKLSTWRQGFKILWTVIRLSFSYNPIFFLTALGSLFTLPSTVILVYEFYMRLLYGEAGSSVGLLWLGLVLFIAGLNSFTIAMITLLIKRQERRIIQQIKALSK